MLSASALFKSSLRYSHQALTRATLQVPGLSSGFTDSTEFTVTGGRLVIDGTRNVWRTADIDLAVQSSLDRAALEDIDSTTRLRLERGIRFLDGTEEWVTLGTFQVQEVTTGRGQGTATVSVADAGSLIEDYGLVTMYAPLDGLGGRLTTIEAIQDLVSTAIVWDTVTWNVDSSLDAVVMPVEGSVFNGSRWEAVRTLAESIGAIVYVGADGVWQIKSASLAGATPVDEYATGEDGVLVDYTTVRSRSSQYNAIPLRWENPTGGGLAFIVDSDPASPTYWNGPFGRRPREVETNDTIETSTQAIDAATALLDQYKGRSASLQFTSVHNPLLEPNDIITVRTRSFTQEHVIDSIDYPLAGGTMRCTTRMISEV